MSKAGKTNTTRPFCLIFEIFMGGSPDGCACFVATPLWGMEYAWVQSYIYIGLKLAAPFSATPPYALFLAWDCTHSRTGKAGHARGP